MGKYKFTSILLAGTILLGLGEAGWAQERDLLKINRNYLEKTYDWSAVKKNGLEDFQLLRQGVSVVASSDDYIWAIAGNEVDGYGNVLYRSGDLGESFERVHSFKEKIEGLHISPLGTIFLSTSRGRWRPDAGCEIFRSLDGGQSFDKVLDLESGAAINWNFASDDEGYVFISEYGYKLKPNNARRIYRSRDGGANFEKVYEPEENYHSHNHIIQIDRDNKNIIYQSIGDINKKVIVSRDRGESWQTLIPDLNPTSMVQIDGYILFGLDNHPRSGIIRYDKASGKTSYSLATPAPYRGSIYDILDKDGVLYAGLMSYSQADHTWPGSVFISRDRGRSWENILAWPKLTSQSGIGFNNMVEKDGYGFINCMLPMYVNKMAGHYVGTVRFKLF